MVWAEALADWNCPRSFAPTFFGPGLGRLLSRFDPSAGFVDEVRQVRFAHPLVADPQESHWLSIGGVGHHAATAWDFQIAGLSAFFGAPLFAPPFWCDMVRTHCASSAGNRH
jgi:hypothetical protein